jgi:hypothetical protein
MLCREQDNEIGANMTHKLHIINGAMRRSWDQKKYQ